jgi:hypothetical protein
MNNSNDISELMKDIFQVASNIQVNYPELYLLLDETPLFLSNNNTTISSIDLKQYLRSLKMQLKTFKKV